MTLVRIEVEAGVATLTLDSPTNRNALSMALIDELVAALAGGAALSFEPDADDDDLLPGDRVARAEAAVA